MKRLLSVVLAFLLMLGLAFPVLAAKASTATMRVELVEGSITIRDAGGVALDYYDGIRLYSGYSVETGDDSCAYIKLDEEKAIKLAMDTAVTLKKSGRKLQAQLRAGEIAFNVTAPLAGNELLEIRTGALSTSIRGSSGGVNAETGEIFYGTGHGVVWFRETEQTNSLYVLPQRTELWGGRIVSVNWPVKDMEISDFSALFLGEVAENPELQDSLKNEGRFDPQDMINLLPLALEKEAAAREEAKVNAVLLPDIAQDSPVNGDNVNPAFNKNWDLPTIVTPPPIIDLDDFIIPDDPMNPDEPETTAFTVTWQDEDGTILEIDKNVPVGTVPEFNGSDPVKAADAQYTYTFAGWDSAPVAVTGDAIYTATYKGTVRTYTVTWKDETGAVLETDENVAYGTTPSFDSEDPIKAADAQYTYTFAGWSPEISGVTSNVTYTAKYSSAVNTYTVTWKVGNEVKELDENVPYGSTPSYDGEEPTKDPTDEYTYAFQGWTPAITAETTVTGNMTYTAVFAGSDRYFTITWKDGDTVIGIDSYKAGAAITNCPEPKKEGVAFDGWDGTVPEVMPAENKTFQAKWLPLYTVTFDMNGHGDPITAQSVKSGGYAVPPDAPTEDGVVFDGWYADEATTVPFSFADSPITGVTTVYAKWSAVVHVVIPEASGIAVSIGGSAYAASTDLRIPAGSVITIKFTQSDAYVAGPATQLTAGETPLAEGAQIAEATDGYSYTVAEEVTITLKDLYQVIHNANLPEKISGRAAIVGDVAITETYAASGPYLIEGDLYITETGSLTVKGAEYPTCITENAALTNKGALTIDGGAVLSNCGLLINEGSLLIAYDATLQNTGSITQQNSGRIYSFGEIINGEDDGPAASIVNGKDSFMLIQGSMLRYTESAAMNSGLVIIADYESMYELFTNESTAVLSFGGLCDYTIMDDLTIEALDDSTYWYLDADDGSSSGTLTIVGNGAIPDYELYEDSVETPWFEVGYDINDLVIEIKSGVTKVGNYAFYGLSSASIRVLIASSVASIGDHAFDFSDSNLSCELHFRGDPPTLGSDSPLPAGFTLYYTTEAWEEAITKAPYAGHETVPVAG